MGRKKSVQSKKRKKKFLMKKVSQEDRKKYYDILHSNDISEEKKSRLKRTESIARNDGRKVQKIPREKISVDEDVFSNQEMVVDKSEVDNGFEDRRDSAIENNSEKGDLDEIPTEIAYTVRSRKRRRKQPESYDIDSQESLDELVEGEGAVGAVLEEEVDIQYRKAKQKTHLKILNPDFATADALIRESGDLTRHMMNSDDVRSEEEEERSAVADFRAEYANDTADVAGTDDNQEDASIHTGTLDSRFEEENDSFALEDTHKIESMKPLAYRNVERSEAIRRQREALPIIGSESEIIDAIRDNDVVFIVGETGCGKTTQVPQFLYEHGYGSSSLGGDGVGLIGVTQPRRLAAHSMAMRVSEELSMDFGAEVSYSVRHEGNLSENTIIHFMTDGVLLREIKSDNLLSKYSILIIDEAHERSINIDIIITFLSRIQKARWKLVTEEREIEIRSKTGFRAESERKVSWKPVPLKIILMSATLRVDDFQSQFGPGTRINTMKVDNRQYPVTIHFNRETPADYLKEVYVKVSKIHRQLPKGGILVFLTSRAEVEFITQKLKRKFSRTASISGNEDEELDEMELQEELEVEQMDESTETLASLTMKVVPLYAMLPTHKQMEIYRPVEADQRLVVVSTNIAETTITIPGITYVVDSGRVKRKKYVSSSGEPVGVTKYEVSWVSKSSSNQRSGRAGRICPGHVYRLYSSAIYENLFEEQEEPEIFSSPLEGTLLYLSSFGITNFSSFPFPSQPPANSIEMAIQSLKHVGALQEESQRITNLGKKLLVFPLLPRYSKLLLLAKRHKMLVYAVFIAASLSVREMALPDSACGRSVDERNIIYQRRATLRNNRSDLLTLVNICGAYIRSADTSRFCRDFGLNQKVLTETQRIVVQILGIVRDVGAKEVEWALKEVEPMTIVQERQFVEIIAETFSDRIARRKSKNIYETCNGRLARVNDYSGYLPKIGRSSLPEFICFVEIQSSGSSGDSDNMYLKGVSEVKTSLLGKLKTPIITYSEPIAASFDTQSRTIMATVKLEMYGTIRDGLPSMLVPFPVKRKKDENRFYMLLTYFMFNSVLYPEMESWNEYKMADPLTPTSIIGGRGSDGAFPIKRIFIPFIASLKARRIHSISDLEDAWARERKFLLKEYVSCIEPSIHVEIVKKWPPRKQ